MAEFLKDPARTDPGGRMPSLMLNDKEALQLANVVRVGRAGTQAADAQRRQRYVETDEAILRNKNIDDVAALISSQGRSGKYRESDEDKGSGSLGS